MSNIPMPSGLPVAHVIGERLYSQQTAASQGHLPSAKKQQLAQKLRRRSMAILSKKASAAVPSTMSQSSGDENALPSYAAPVGRVAAKDHQFMRPAKPLAPKNTMRPVPAVKPVLGTGSTTARRFGAPPPNPTTSTGLKRPRVGGSNPSLNSSMMNQSMASVASVPVLPSMPKKANIPGWDLKGQLAALTEQMGIIMGRLTAVEKEKEEKEKEVVVVKHVAQEKQEELESILAEKRSLNNQLKDAQEDIEKLRTEKSRLKSELDCLQTEKMTVDSRVQNLSRDLEETRTSESQLRSDLRRANSDLGAQRERVGDLERKVQDLKERLDSSERQCDQYKLRIENLEDQLRNVQRQLDDKSSEAMELRSKLQARDMTISELSAKLEASMTSCAQLENEKGNVTRERDGLKQRVAELIEEINRLSAELVKMSEINSDKDERIKNLEAEKEEHYRLRKVLHNRVQELKGNIRVFCRTRPLLPAEKSTNAELLKLDTPDIDHKKLIIHTTENDAAGQARPKLVDFEFDRVFSSTDSQADCFEELSQLVQSAMDGYNVAIFAYGQTGSGKTYTMEGLDEWSEHDATFEQRGMIPRAIEQIFQSASELASRSWKFEMTVSFIEIYNETLLDLLDDNENQAPHEIQLADKKTNDVIVVGLKAAPIKSKMMFYQLMRQARRNRHVAETKMNRESSRSHSLCQIKIEGLNEATNENIKSTLSLIDLAGSERLKDSGSTGVRAQEAISINSSLSALSNVIVAIHNRDAHIPYRDSKLTYLLMNSLGGQAKALMFVNFNPCQRFVAETLNSLRFATKVNGCTIGTARRNAGGADSKKK